MYERIQSESECKEAAEELYLTWGDKYTDPHGAPGCSSSSSSSIFTNDHRKKVYFNAAKDANNLNHPYEEICTQYSGKRFSNHHTISG